MRTGGGQVIREPAEEFARHWKELGKCCSSDQQVGQREFEGEGSADEEVTWQVVVGLLKHKGPRS